LDSTAARGNLLVGHATCALFKLIHARAGEDWMGMSVNKAWQYHATPGVDYFAVPRNQSLDRLTLSGAFNSTIANK
jgi:hypothetical protein